MVCGVLSDVQPAGSESYLTVMEFYLCEVCLSQAAESIQNKMPLRDLLLFRTYSESKWCKHADSETVLMAFDDYDSIDNAWCQKCIIEEQERRTILKPEN